MRVPPPITLAGGQPAIMRPPLHRILGPRAFYGLLLCGFLTACSIPLPPEGLQAPWATPTVEEPCYWTWGDEPLPELSAQVQAAMEGAGLLGVQAWAQAHGEYCTGYVTGESNFHQAATDFEVVLPVDSFEDREALGNLFKRSLAVLSTFTGNPSDTISVVFNGGEENISGGEDIIIRLANGDLAEARQQAESKSGEALFDVLMWISGEETPAP